MLHNMQITELLNLLETEGVTDAEIIEKMKINRSTLTRWWKSNSATPRYLQKMRIWCRDFIPVEAMFVGQRPPREMFLEAIEVAAQTDNKEYSRMLHKMSYKGFYEHGIPAAETRRGMNRYKSFYAKPRPTTEYVRDIIRRFHPDQKIREGFRTDEQV